MSSWPSPSLSLLETPDQTFLLPRKKFLRNSNLTSGVFACFLSSHKCLYVSLICDLKSLRINFFKKFSVRRSSSYSMVILSESSTTFLRALYFFLAELSELQSPLSSVLVAAGIYSLSYSCWKMPLLFPRPTSIDPFF